MNMIKTIIFDFGDVFINLDKTATNYEIQKHFGEFTIDECLKNTNNAYEKGEITSEIFIKFYADYFNTKNKDLLINIWNAIILDFPEYRLKFIEDLATSNAYKLILLSNTNELHIKQVTKNMQLNRYERFKNCFDAFYLSHNIGFRKPDSTIYEFALQQNKILAHETLFIDDTKANTEAASHLGFHTWALNPDTDDITELFTIKKDLF